MKKTKRILSIFLSVLMLVLSVPVFSVPASARDLEFELHVWISDNSTDETLGRHVPDKMWCGKPYYLNYEIYETRTKKPLSYYTSDFSVTEYLYDVDGLVWDTATYKSTSESWFKFTTDEPGSYKGKVVCSGYIDLECEVEWEILDTKPTTGANTCPYCGGVHSGFLGFFTKLIHNFLALFGLKSY